jgi:hypothetical protein
MKTVSGGDKLKAALGDIAKNLSNGAKLSVGFLADATYPDGTSVAMVAAIQEFGSKTIPPRPFFRNMIAEKSPEWPHAVGDLLKDNDFNAKVALEQTGAGIKGQLQQSIVDTMDPPLSPVTLMLRKMKAENPDLVVSGATVGEAARRVAAGESYGGASTKPLVESGHLLQSVDYTVETK